MTQLGESAGGSSFETAAVDQDGAAPANGYDVRIATEQGVLTMAFQHNLPLPVCMPTDEDGSPLPFWSMDAISTQRLPIEERRLIEAYSALSDAVEFANSVRSSIDVEDPTLRGYRNHALSAFLEGDSDAKRANDFAVVANILLAGRTDPISLKTREEQKAFLGQHRQNLGELSERMQIRSGWLDQIMDYFEEQEQEPKPDHRGLAWALRALAEKAVDRLGPESASRWVTHQDITRLVGVCATNVSYGENFIDVVSRTGMSPKELRVWVVGLASAMVKQGDYLSFPLEK